jgi:FkbM family methyltransferase
MRKIFNFIKSLFRPVIHVIRKKQFRSKLLANLNTQNLAYSFTKEDIELYVQEVFTPLQTLITKKNEDANLVTMTIDRTKIYWPASQSQRDLPWLFHEVFDNFKKNPSSYDNPNLAYETRSWIIDAGAAEGYFSIFALKKSSASLICIEPLPIMKIALEKTLSLYPNGKPSIVISSALSDKAGWADIQIDENHICDSKLVSTSSPVFEQGVSGSTSQRVPITTLDQIAIDRKLGVNGLIKMDIEGYEMLALTGAVNLMRNFKPALAVAVYHDLDNAKKCAEIIKTVNPAYRIEFRGFYGYFEPARPYMIFAY